MRMERKEEKQEMWEDEGDIFPKERNSLIHKEEKEKEGKEKEEKEEK